MLTREQVEQRLNGAPKPINWEFAKELLDHDAALRDVLDTSMKVQEQLAKNVNDGLLEIRGLRAQLMQMTAERKCSVCQQSTE